MEWGLKEQTESQRQSPCLGAPEKKIWLAFEAGQYLSIDQLVLQTGLEVSELQVALLQMELAGYLRNDPGRGYTRSAKE